MNQIEQQNLYVLIGKEICKRRKEKGINQEDLAKRIGLTRTSITNIEKGRQKILIHTLIDISRELGIFFWQLIPFEKSFSNSLETLPVKGKRAVEKVLSELE